MCGDGGRAPGSAAEALRLVNAGLDCLNGPAGAWVDAAALGDVLVGLGEIRAKLAAAHAAFLRRFDAAGAHDVDGYPTSASWLAGRTRMTSRDARADVRRMRQLGEHPGIADALAAGQISESLGREMAEWTRRLPHELRAETENILLGAAAAGADLQDLATIAAYALEKWRSRQPDPDDDDSFDDRFVQLGVTFGGAACLRGALTPECAAAVRAVLDALGKKRGPEDHRTEGQRLHDALQEGCELLIRAKMVPDRAGADTHVLVHVPLSALRDMPGASELEAAWLAARLGEPGYLTGKDAEVAACDALIIPAVTGHADMGVIDQMIELAMCAAGWHRPACAGPGSDPAGSGNDQRPDAAMPRPLSPEAWAALRYAIARLAVDFVSGPNGIAAALRTGLLQPPYSTPSLPLDIGVSEYIPASIRRAVTLRDKHCAWPGGCDRPASACDVHHIVHQADGGPTSVTSCALYCQYHHDVCIHREGWQIIMHPDGTSEARSPDGRQVLRSHAPPSTPAA